MWITSQSTVPHHRGKIGIQLCLSVNTLTLTLNILYPCAHQSGPQRNKTNQTNYLGVEAIQHKIKHKRCSIKVQRNGHCLEMEELNLVNFHHQNQSPQFQACLQSLNSPICMHRSLLNTPVRVSCRSTYGITTTTVQTNYINQIRSKQQHTFNSK